jgi:hypothetical protein
MFYDLHLHSSYSDGENTPEHILRYAMKTGVKGIAITDHNGISPKIKQIKTSIADSSIDLIEGIEISSQMSPKYRNLNLHILGYSSNFDVKKINKNLRKTIIGYENRAKQIIKKCNKLGIPINYNELKKRNDELYISRNTIAKEILKHRKIPFKEALKIAFIDKRENWFLSPFQVISLIRESGGIPVLAHPGKLIPQLTERHSKSIFEQLVDCGLQGVEAFYPIHTKSETNKLLDLAHEYDLLVTGGTDYHGPNRSPYQNIGNVGVSRMEFNHLKERLSGQHKHLTTFRLVAPPYRQKLNHAT